MKKFILLFVIAPISLLALTIGFAFYNVHIWSYEGPNTNFIIKKGEGFARINGRLAKNKLISSPQLFHRYSQYREVMSKFKPGAYTIRKGYKMDDIIDIFLAGVQDFVVVTIPEGKNLFEIGKILEDKRLLKKEEFIDLAKNEGFVKSLGINGKRAEGYLYPETYHFSMGMSAKSIIKSMVQTFKKKTNSLDFSKSHLSKHEIVILASMVEKETGAGWERPLIAGVFLNRLKKPMRLQSDPTTIYGIFEKFNGNLRKKHLLQKTPYNTYKVNGLPIGPIANPGLASLQAVLAPKEHNFYYFVSYNDGTHKFSTSYREHRKAVNELQKNARARKGKSWRDLKSRAKSSGK